MSYDSEVPFATDSDGPCYPLSRSEVIEIIGIMLGIFGLVIFGTSPLWWPELVGWSTVLSVLVALLVAVLLGEYRGAGSAST